MASITWEPNVGSIVYGELIEESIFSARAVYQDTDGDDYSPDGTYVYTYSGGGSGTLAAGIKLIAGNYTLTVQFTPSDGTLGGVISGTASLTVEKATPVVIWNNPSNIKYTYDGSSGPKLSVEQLNATTDVAGTFAYSPALDTELSAGTQIVTATFTPADTANYKALPRGGETLQIEFEVLKGDIHIDWDIFHNGVYRKIKTPKEEREIPYILDFEDAKAKSLGIDVPGTFQYSPARGTQLKDSTNLVATFTPTSADNWNPATVTLPFTVYKTITGPEIPPTMFGCFVQSVSASVGWGGTSSSCSIKLVEDPNTSLKWTPPGVGAACYFKYKGFVFGGVFVRWSYSDSTSGRYYDIVLESPAKLLDGVQVIMDGFEGTEYNFGTIPEGKDIPETNETGRYNRFRPSSQNPNVTTQVNNVYNALGHFENHTFEFEGRRGVFGAAQTNSAGFLANKLLETVELLSCPDENPTAKFAQKCAFGEVNNPNFDSTISPNPDTNPEKIPQQYYKIDLSEIKDIAPDLYRIQGVTQSVNGIISDVTELVQNDYFVTLEPDPVAGKFLPPVGGLEGDDGGGVIQNPNIKIKAISKGAQPAGGVIQSLVKSFKEREVLISSSIGQELQDDTTQKLVLGGPGSRLVVRDIYNSFPVWGKLPNSQFIVSGDSTGISYADDYDVPVFVDPFSSATGYFASPFELRMSQDRQAWQTFKVFQSVKRGTYGTDPWCIGIDIDVNTLQALAAGNRGALSLASTSTKTGGIAFNTRYDKNKTLNAQDYTNKLHTAVSNVAKNFFGRVFVIPMPEEPGGPDNNIRFILEDQKFETSWDSVDSAFDPGSTEFPTNFKFNDVAMFDGSGRTKTYAEWYYNMARDFTSLGSNYAVLRQESGDNMWTQNKDEEGRIQRPTITVGANGENIIRFEDDLRNGVASVCSILKGSIVESHPIGTPGRPFVVVDAGSQILETDEITTDDFGLTVLAQKFFGIYIDPRKYIGPGKSSTQIKIPPKIVSPRSFGIAQQSNRYVWGPWYGGNLKGKTEVISDDSLVPETFGTVEQMNAAGESLASVGNAEMSASETGYVEIAEFPSYNIAERFAGSGPYVSDMSFSIDTGGFKTTYKFNTWTPQFGKLAKYNIDRIARINKASLELAQRERAKITKAPFAPPPVPPGANELIARLQTNRTNAGWTGSQFFSNPHVEATMMDLGDAAAMSMEFLDDDGNAVDPASDTKYKSSAGCTVDQQWTGYETRKDKTSYTTENVPTINSPKVVGEGSDDGILPNSKQLDPYFSNAIYQGDDGTKAAENVDYMAANIDVNGARPENLQFHKLNSQDRSNITAVRSMNALKGPPILSGWGYDIAYNPVPADGNGFDQDTLSKRSLSATGPIRLLWDNERNIWSGGPEILCGTLASPITPADSPLNPSPFTVNVLRKVPGSDKGEEGALEPRGETITGYNRDTALSASAGDNTWVMVIRVNYEWIPFWVSCT